MNAIDIILQSKNQTVTKSELMDKLCLAATTIENQIRHLRDDHQIITVAIQDDTRIIGAEYAKSKYIRPLSRRDFNKKTQVNPFTKEEYKTLPNHKPKIRCCRCEKYKDPVLFSNNKANQTGKNYSCKKCDSLRYRAHDANKEEQVQIDLNNKLNRCFKVTKSHLTLAPGIINATKKELIEQDIILQPTPTRKIESLFNWEG